MPEDTKKTHQKGKSDPKEQRRKRQPRQPAAVSVDKKVDKVPETRVPVAEKIPPVYEPPPEFYQNLKRETDDILKITEEANAKYQKKEIQSNWAKYEMPIESYEEIDEQENLGADYQALIDASLSVGGHFQFKHEKSWDVSTGPSPYDKYFEIDMENLNIALSSIPFYERNSIDLSLFNESDILSMEHRATKYKQKYYNNKEYTTPELQAQDKILNSFRKSDEIEDVSENNKINDFDVSKSSEETIPLKISANVISEIQDVSENNKINDVDVSKSHKQAITLKISENITSDNKEESEIQSFENVDTPLHENDIKLNLNEVNAMDTVDNENNAAIIAESIEHSTVNFLSEEIEFFKKEGSQEKNADIVNLGSNNLKELKQVPKEEPKNPIIESPEDLEKWLDDFLDG